MDNTSNWIQWWPSLEVSFMLSPNLKVLDIINILSKLPYNLQIIATQEKIDNNISKFDEWYLFDETDSNSSRIHSLKLPLRLDICWNRKAMLTIDKLSYTISMVNIYFYWSEHDALEWWQLWVSKEQVVEFKKFLDDIFRKTNFLLWTVEFEKNVSWIFKTNNCSPHESYNLNNIDFSSLKNYAYTINNCGTLWNI